MAFGRVSTLLLVLMVAAMMGATVSTASAAPPSPSPPHIVLIVADDLGWNDVSWHNRQVVTPQLEALARSGVLLQQSYVQPICTPTRSALLAGRYPFTIGRQNSVLWPMEPTGLDLNLTLLPQSLKVAGYSTHAVGKWHLGFCSWAYTPTERGFDTFYGYYTGAEDYYSHVRPPVHLCSKDGWWSEGDGESTRLGYDFRNNTQSDHQASGTYSTYLFASYIEELVSSRDPKEPMFLYLPFQSVHSPNQVPDNYTKPYSHIQDRERRIKLGMVSAMDEAVGRVVAALKASGHYNNSIIVFTTDNGGPTVTAGNNWPLRGNKTTIWEGGTRGAAFVHSPLLPNPGTVLNQLVHVTDWYRTLVGVAGGVAPPDTDGVDQWAAIMGAAPSPRTHMVYNIDNTTDFKAGVRIGDYKLLVGDPGPGEWTPPPEDTITVHHVASDQVVATDDPTFISSTSQPDVTQYGSFPPSTLNPTHLDLGQATGSSYDSALTDLDDFAVDHSNRVQYGATQAKEAFQSKKVIHTKNTYAGPFLVRVPLAVSEYEKDAWEDEVVERAQDEGLENEKNATVLEVIDEGKNLTNSPDIAWSQNGMEEEQDGDEMEVEQLLQLLNTNLSQIRLYNITDDPEERVNLAPMQLGVVRELLRFLLQQMPRYVPADIKPNDPSANPVHWHNDWTPGWC